MSRAYCRFAEWQKVGSSRVRVHHLCQARLCIFLAWTVRRIRELQKVKRTLLKDGHALLMSSPRLAPNPSSPNQNAVLLYSLIGLHLKHSKRVHTVKGFNPSTSAQSLDYITLSYLCTVLLSQVCPMRCTVLMVRLE